LDPQAHPENDSAWKFKTIFEYSPLAIMYTDPRGTITACNANASKLFGAPQEKLIGFSYKLIRDKRMRRAIVKALMGKKSRFEGEYLTVTGNVRTYMRANFSPGFFPDGSVSGVIGIFEDMSARRRVDCLERGPGEDLGAIVKPSGFLPICASCKRIRDPQGKWNPVELYLKTHCDINLSHGVCPECSERLYPDVQPAKAK